MGQEPGLKAAVIREVGALAEVGTVAGPVGEAIIELAEQIG
jgi:hypothetical protein